MRRYIGILVVGLLIVVTVITQITVFSRFIVDGAVPDVALLFVIATALVRGPDYAAAVGFVTGLVLDLAPPADGTAGRWALSFVVVGYLTGLAKPDTGLSKLGTLAITAAGAFVGTSVYALTGLVLRDQGVTIASVFDVIPKAVLYDVALTPLVIPALIFILRRLEPARRW